MIRWQDDFYAYMAERWPELERGTPAVETKRRHLTPQWYKKVTAMDAKLERLETALNGINVLNAGKKREEAVALLAQLLAGCGIVSDRNPTDAENSGTFDIPATSLYRGKRSTEKRTSLRTTQEF